MLGGLAMLRPAANAKKRVPRALMAGIQMGLCPQSLGRAGRAIPAGSFLELPGQPPPEASGPSPSPPLSPQTQILLSVGPLSEASANVRTQKGVTWGVNSTEPLKDQGFFNFTRGGDLTLFTQRCQHRLGIRCRRHFTLTREVPAPWDEGGSEPRRNWS